MSDHTPSLDDVRTDYAQLTARHRGSFFGNRAEFDRAIAKVRADAKVEALREAADELTEVIESVQSGSRPNGIEWQTGALAMRDWIRATS